MHFLGVLVPEPLGKILVLRRDRLDLRVVRGRQLRRQRVAVGAVVEPQIAAALHEDAAVGLGEDAVAARRRDREMEHDVLRDHPERIVGDHAVRKIARGLPDHSEIGLGAMPRRKPVHRPLDEIERVDVLREIPRCSAG